MQVAVVGNDAFDMLGEVAQGVGVAVASRDIGGVVVVLEVIRLIVACMAEGKWCEHTLEEMPWRCLERRGRRLQISLLRDLN